jgi:hypothetical protein
VIEGSYNIAEDNRKVKDGTYKSDKVEGRIAKKEAIAATLGESDYY